MISAVIRSLISTFVSATNASNTDSTPDIDTANLLYKDDDGLANALYQDNDGTGKALFSEIN